MTPYVVLATGFKLGYIQFVENSRDLIRFHYKYSYNCGMSIHQKCLVNWLWEKVETEIKNDFKKEEEIK